MARANRIEATTTAAIVTLSNGTFVDQDTIEMDLVVIFNGFADNYTGTVTFARNATTAQKNTAIRNLINDLLVNIEGTAKLSNANIQIVGLPV